MENLFSSCFNFHKKIIKETEFYMRSVCSAHTRYAELANSIEITIAIDIFGTIAIGIAIAKTRFLLIDLLLLLLTRMSNYCYCY